MKTKSIPLTEEEAVTAMLENTQGRATVRTLGLADLLVAMREADDLLDFIGLSKAKRHGLILTVEQGGVAISKRGYRIHTWLGDMTVADLKFDARKGWRLASVDRRGNNGIRFRWRVTGYPADLHKVLAARWR